MAINGLPVRSGSRGPPLYHSFQNVKVFLVVNVLASFYINDSIIFRSLVLGMRSIGRGRKAADILSAHLGLPPPIWPVPWAEHTRVLDDKLVGVLESELKESVRNLKRHKVCKLVSIIQF